MGGTLGGGSIEGGTTGTHDFYSFAEAHVAINITSLQVPRFSEKLKKKKHQVQLKPKCAPARAREAQLSQAHAVKTLNPALK